MQDPRGVPPVRAEARRLPQVPRSEAAEAETVFRFPTSLCVVPGPVNEPRWLAEFEPRISAPGTEREIPGVSGIAC